LWRGARRGKVNARLQSARRLQAAPPLEVGGVGGGERGAHNGRYCGMSPRRYSWDGLLLVLGIGVHCAPWVACTATAFQRPSGQD